LTLTGQVGKPNLCKNIVRAVVSDPKTPPVDEAPITDQVTWHYYMGMLAFLNGEDKKATDELTWALLHRPADALRNQGVSRCDGRHDTDARQAHPHIL
jgi:hypothetical protein